MNSTWGPYAQLDIKGHDDNPNIFDEIISDEYKYEIYDDYYHMTKRHQHELHNITELASKKYGLTCDLSTCSYSNRHFRTRKIDHTQEMKHSNPYIEVMDSLHFYILHLFATSFRIKPEPMTDAEIKKAENDEYFDTKFAMLKRAQSRSRAATKRFHRLNTNKFIISDTTGSGTTVTGQSEETTINVTDPEDTFLDHVFQQLQINTSNDFSTKYSWCGGERKDGKSFCTLSRLVIDEEYCTESMLMDLEMFDGGNIYSEVNDRKFMSRLKAIFCAARGSLYLIFMTYVTFVM